MNRKERRSIGFTEPRFRKQDVASNGFNMKLVDPFKSYSYGNADILSSGVIQRTDRLDGKPRRWQTERERRKAIND